jgi:hypothetical protein
MDANADGARLYRIARSAGNGGIRMTNTEIIKGLKAVRTIHNGNYAPFVDAAIKALEQEHCIDAISRQAVLDAIDAKAWEFCDYLISKSRNDEQKPVSHFADILRECICEDLPPVTPQPKMGRWINKHKYNTIYECDNCGRKNVKSNYCPNCGRKMEVSEE